MKSTGSLKLARVVVFSVLFLFFFQLIADFIEAVYAFGLSQGAIPPEIALIALLLSPFLLLFFRKGLPPVVLLILAEGVILMRAVEPLPLLDTRGRMFAAGIGVTLFLLLLPSLLWSSGQNRDRASGAYLGAGLTLGVTLSILLRVLGSGLDLSTVGMFQAIGWALAIVTAILIPKNLLAEDLDTPAASAEPPPAGRAKIAGLSFGLMAALILLYFAFTSPTVIARWTGFNYPLIIAILVVALVAFAWIASQSRAISSLRRPTILVVVTALFTGALALTLFAYQESFPASFDGYPFVELQPGVWAVISLLIALILFPIILLDFAVLAEETVLGRPSMPALGLGFGLASLFLVLMVLANVFTTVYDYIPIVGPFFRDKYWLVYLALGLVLTLSLLLINRPSFQALGSVAEEGRPGARAFPITILVVGLASLIAVFLISASPPEAAAAPELVVASYNIRQAYSDDMAKNFDGQLEILQQIDADIIGLQETDNARINGGNADVVRYLADKLDMYSYYGPKTVTGTFGDALLSKYPIENATSYYLYSDGEQVAVVEAQVTAGDHTYNIYVNHFGNTCRFPDQEQQLAGLQQLMAGKENVIALGDFNFGHAVSRTDACVGGKEPVMQGFQEELLKTLDEDDACGRVMPNDGLDHIFVSQGMGIVSECIDDPASDHPLLWARLQPAG